MHLADTTKRYSQFDELIALVKPKSLIEVGTHRGLRAAHMSILALLYQENVSYLGFDIFGGDAEFHRAAMNDKSIPTQERAEWTLNKVARNHLHRFTWTLIRGDTRETLAGQHIVADFVFIDGDHRLATIRSDYAALQGSKCVVFDDYFLPGPNGELPDLDVYGANRLVDSIDGAEVLTDNQQQNKRGWFSAMAVVMQ